MILNLKEAPFFGIPGDFLRRVFFRTSDRSCKKKTTFGLGNVWSPHVGFFRQLSFAFLFIPNKRAFCKNEEVEYGGGELGGKGNRRMEDCEEDFGGGRGGGVVEEDQQAGFELHMPETHRYIDLVRVIFSLLCSAVFLNVGRLCPVKNNPMSLFYQICMICSLKRNG